MPKPYTVLIADQHSVCRAGVKAALAKERCKVIEAENGREAVRLAVKHKPQLIVLDIPMLKLNGLDAADQIITGGSGARVLVLTAVNDDFAIARALYIGVHGYLCKTSQISMLPEVARVLLSGQTWYSPAVQNYQARHAHMPKRNPLPLTQREIEVMQLIAERHQNKNIAQELELSAKTVDRHRQSLMRKLNRNDSVGLTHYAIMAGLVTPQ